MPKATLLRSAASSRTRALGSAVLVVLLGACGYPSEHTTPSTRFASPLVGRTGEELFHGAYIDEGSRDYNCGTKYYTGHKGTDILLRNFRVQDSGVTVVAAAAGRVSQVHDGEPDRNSVADNRNVWNAVYIDHPDGLTSVYGHLRRGSILVSVGQTVSAGTPLALVGSSGFSNWPHLHFEVHSGAVIADPWEGSCAGTTSLWQAQLPYQDAFRVLDIGVQDRRITTMAELLERPADPAKITGAEGVMSAWIEMHNIRAELLRAELHAPDGALVQGVDYPNFSTYSTIYALATYPVSAGLPAGRWTAVFLARTPGGIVLAEIARLEFQLDPAHGASAAVRSRIVQAPVLTAFAPGGDRPW